MKYTINKQMIIEEADFNSVRQRVNNLTKASEAQNNRLGPKHPSTIRNEELNNKKPLQENAAVKIGAVGAAGKAVHLGAKFIKRKVDDVDGFGDIGKNVSAINKAVDDMH